MHNVKVDFVNTKGPSRGLLGCDAA